MGVKNSFKGENIGLEQRDKDEREKEREKKKNYTHIHTDEMGGSDDEKNMGVRLPVWHGRGRGL